MRTSQIENVFILLVGLLFASGATNAQLKAKVTVDPSQAKAALYTTSIGIVADRWDTNAYDAATIQLLQDAGITNIRFPGNGGIDALYHWSTGAITNPYTDDRAPAFPREKMFPAVAPIMDKLGTSIVSVNYGSNLDGSGGGEPAEAAAWVAYANGDPANTQVIGKDSKGNDWKTVGFWAGLRAATPLATDDGYNHLRIGRASSFGILLWTIGNEPWGNGFYNQAQTVGSDADNTGKYGQSPSPEPDLHAGKVHDSKAWGHNQGNAKVGPATYGAAVVDYVKAMKAVDPKILIGAFVMKPPYANDSNQYGKNWNAGVLKAACASMDFSAATFWEGKAAPPNYTDDLDELDLLTSARDEMDPNRHYPKQNALQHDYDLLGNDLIDKYKKFCPSGHFPPLAITGLGVSGWIKPKNPAANALFAADAYARLLQTGAYTVVWAPIHALGATFLDNDNKPQAAYYGIKLFHQMAGPGDQLVQTNSQMETLNVYATKRRDGGLGLLFINSDLIQSVAVNVSVIGYNYGTKGTRYDYGKQNMDDGKAITEAPIDNLGATFTVEVPRYGVTAVVIPAGQ